MIKKLTTLTFIFHSIISAFAGHMNGAEITYKELDSNKLLVILNVYRDCRGISFSGPTTGFYFGKNGDNSCDGSTLTFKRISIEDVTPRCSTSSTPCYPSNTAGTGEGIEKHTYTYIADLNSALFTTYYNKNSYCRELTFYAGQCCRGSSITTGPAGNDFYCLCTINLTNLSKCRVNKNNSPVWTIAPPSFACCNQAIYHNPGLIDSAEHDSISYKLVHGINSLPSSSISYSSPFSYQYPATPYCIPNTTIKCTPYPQADPPRGFFMDTTNGNLVFTPTKCDEVSVFVIEATEYRKDSTGKYVWIGKTRRDWQLIVKDNCGYNNSVKITGTESSVICAGDKICIDIKATDATFVPYQTVPDTTSISWNNAIPKATFKIQNATKREKTAQFCWQTDSTDISEIAYNFAVLATDQHCPKPSVSSKNFSVKVRKLGKSTMVLKPITCNRMTLSGSIPNSTLPNFNWRITDSAGNTVYTGNRKNDTTEYLAKGRYYVALNSYSKEFCTHTNYDSFQIKTGLPTGTLGASFKTCPGSDVELQPSFSNSTGPWTYFWYANNKHHIGDTLNTYLLTNIREPYTIIVKCLDKNGCNVAIPSIIIDTFPAPRIAWKSTMLDIHCYNAGNFNLDELIVTPSASTPRQAFSIKGNLFGYGKTGLADSAAPNRYIFNTKKINNANLQNGQFVEETLTAWFRDTNGCDNSATAKQRIYGSPIFQLKSPQYCQNSMPKIWLDSLVNPDKNGWDANWNTLSVPSTVDASEVLRPAFPGTFFEFGSAGLNQYSGSYKLRYCATDVTIGCQACDSNIIVLKPQPVLVANPDLNACYGNSNFDLLNTLKSNGQTPATNATAFKIMNWNGNSNQSTWSGASIVGNHFFPASNLPGVWSFRTTNVISSCSASLDVNLQIYPKPKASFITNPTDSAIETLPYFWVANSSSISPLTPLSFVWNFDMRDPFNISSTANDPVITYPNTPKTYTIRLIAVSQKGCKDTAYRNIKVHVNYAGLSDFGTSGMGLNQRFMVTGLQPAQLEIHIYNAAGQQIALLKDNNGIDLPNGIYLYKVQLSTTEGRKYLQTGKMAVMH